MAEEATGGAAEAADSAEGSTAKAGRGKGLYYVHTLGCQMNVHDSERIAGVLESDGYVKANQVQIDSHDLDLIVMNTCAVRENASNRMYGTLGQWAELKRENPRLQIAVGGCMAQKDRQRITERAPWVDAVFGTKNIGSLTGLLDKARAERRSQVQVATDLDYFPSQLPVSRASRVSAWVAISMGCNNTCTFCIVPSVRGRERDRRPGDVLDEIQRCVDAGSKEVTLLGQNVNSYGYSMGDRYAFSKLLRACGKIDGLERVRFTSPHPAAFTDDVIEAMAETPNVMHQLHMPLQSGSDRILRAMRRSYRTAKFMDILGKVRAAMPDAQISTDVIVGFPGETEEDFQRTLDLISQARFASAYTFEYFPPARDPCRLAAPDPGGRHARPLHPPARPAGGDHGRGAEGLPRQGSGSHGHRSGPEGREHPPDHRPGEDGDAGSHRSSGRLPGRPGGRFRHLHRHRFGPPLSDFRPGSRRWADLFDPVTTGD